MQTPPRHLRIIALPGIERPRELRGAPSIDWIPITSPLEALAELARPSDTDADLEQFILVPLSYEPLEEPDELERFLDAARRLDPMFHTVRIADEPEGCHFAITPEELDSLDEPNAHERLTNPPFHDAAPPLAEAHVDPEQPPTPATPDAPATTSIDLAPDLATAVIRTEPVLPAALRILRRSLGADLRFIDDPAGAPTARPVAWRGHVFGHLHAPNASREALAEAAEQLAPWLQLDRQQAELRRAALTDPLTGANNRRYFDGYLTAAIESASSARGVVTLLVFDIDHFKQFNDRHGHAAGDEILCETVRLIRSLVRPADRVCRIGGDEFAVIFTDEEAPRKPNSKPPRDIFQIAQRFQKAIAAQMFPKLGEDAPGALTISGGLACYPWDGATPTELLERADHFAMESKRTGKNAITIGPGAERMRKHGPAS